jgi:hypothetical protein
VALATAGWEADKSFTTSTDKLITNPHFVSILICSYCGLLGFNSQKARLKHITAITGLSQ